MHLERVCGVHGLVGKALDDQATASLVSLQERYPSFERTPLPFHVTLLSKDEFRGLSQDRVASLELDTRHVHILGVGGYPSIGVFYLIIIWAAGQQLRMRLGLPPKHFHATLSRDDDHDVQKGISSLLPDQSLEKLGTDALDHIAFTLHAFQDHTTARPYCRELVRALPDSERGYLRLGDCALQACQHKLAMLSFACAFQRTSSDRVQAYAVKKLVERAQQTEWGPMLLEDEEHTLPEELHKQLLTPWSAELKEKLSETKFAPQLCLESREKLQIPFPASFDRNLPSLYKLPRFFRWVVPFYLAVMSTPRNETDIAALASPALGIRHVLTLTEETPLEASWFRTKNIRNTYLPIPNYHSPSIEQMDIILRLCDEEDNLPLLVHCGGGKGRAGTVIACYLVTYGFGKPNPGLMAPTMSASDAISALRSIRPGSIETAQQEAFVAKWCSTIWKRQSVAPAVVPEPSPCPLVIEGVLRPDSDLFMLVGLPGSGKSWLSASLQARSPTGWMRISQDDSGSRASCETQISRQPSRGKMLLDRCNTSTADRKVWLQLAAIWTKAPVAVWFDFSRELCTSRAQSRIGHPTLPPGSRVRNAISQMDKTFDRPTLKEGFKAVAIVRSFAAAQELVARLSPPITLLKFPRTQHLLNLGAATDDDLISSSALTSDGGVVITEKIDGANMGFSLAADRCRILVQNRSHYVNSASHEQFKKLDVWLETRGADIRRVLDHDPHFAERFILYGEWMSATHSIPYTRLPDRFVAFDMYDRTTDTFIDRDGLQALLESTSLQLVPVVYQGPMPSQAELRAMVHRPSQFYDGPVEGIYIKLERDGKVIHRGKVVRGDFISGNEHWTKGQIRMNGFVSDQM